MEQTTPTSAPSKSPTCTLCDKRRKPEAMAGTICEPCFTRLRIALGELPALWVEAHNCLEPARGGFGSNTGEPTLGVNLTALDYISGQEILDTLHGWERVIREDRRLTPPALLSGFPTLGHAIAGTVAFHQRHLEWVADQDWCDEFAKEVFAVHAKGKAAARKFLDPVRRISCPSPECRQTLSVSDSDLLAIVPCKSCGTQWTVARLIAVGSTTSEATWVDSESIGTWLGISAGHVRRIAAKAHVQRKGGLLHMQQVIAAYKGRASI